MRIRIKLTAVLILLWTSTSFGQIHPDKVKYQQITIAKNTGDKKFQTLNDLDKKFKTKITRWYHWYQPHELHITAGDYSGRLLHGEYKEFFEDGSLKRKGAFKKGIKHGEWKEWHPNGQLKEVADWQKGEKHGVYISFDSMGNVILDGVFKRGTYAGVKVSGWKKFVDFITMKKLRNVDD